MPRKPNDIPEAKARYNRGAWYIYWRYKGTQYNMATGMNREDDAKAAERIRRQISNCLAIHSPFPAPYDATPAAIKYREERFGKKETKSTDYTEWLEIYRPQLAADCSSQTWVENSMAFLAKLEAFAGGLDVSPDLARKFLAHYSETHKPASRNRALAALKRFYRWSVETLRLDANPFAGIPSLPEPPPETIAYCTKSERDRIIAAARKTGRKDWKAVPIALYTGCRREEIVRMKWSDFLPEKRRLVIPKSKNHKRRVVKMVREMLRLLEEDRKPFGYVVDFVRSEKRAIWVNETEKLVEEIRCMLCRPTACQPDGTPKGSIGKKKFAMTEEDLAQDPPEHCPERAADGGGWIPAERVGWTAWRHTVATILFQNGWTADQVAAMLGNTRGVALQNYIEFDNRDGDDDDIEVLM